MTGRALPVGGDGPWSGGVVTALATCLLAPNPSPWTLEGTNTWIIREGSAAIVVDPGPADAGHLAAIRDALDGTSVTTVLLTHGHSDHAEGARELAESLGVGVRALDPAHRLGVEGLTDGDVVTVGGAALHVVATPGHSSDSLSFVLDAEGSLLTGDTVLGRGTTLLDWPDGRLADYLASLERLQDTVRTVPIARILPGHGPVVAEPARVLAEYVAHRQQRLEEVRAGVTEGITEPMALVERIYADVPREVWPAALITVKAQLEYLGLSTE